MQRPGQLIEQIADYENLYLAYYKASKGKIEKAQVYAYGKQLQQHVPELQRQILAGEVVVGNYHYFTIYDPKQRLICAAPFGQRVLHHALMNVCHPVFERPQIFDSYASRIGKGTYAALDRAKNFSRRCQWFLKLDVRKYFDSLDHDILNNQLRRLFKEKRVLEILAHIIDSYCVQPHQGVPIGNLTSQYFANHYLAGLDHFVKETLNVPAYVRYMDDMVLWHNDKNNLLQAGLRLQQFAADELQLSLKPFCLNRTSYGLPFLGYLVYPDHIRLAHRSRSRFIRKLDSYDRNLASELWTQQQYQQHVSPLIAFTEHANAKEFRKKIIYSW